MLLESTALRGPATHHLDRAMRRETPTHPLMPPDSNDLAGAALSFVRNAEIYGEGEPADHLYRITSGIVRTCKFLIDGRRQVGAFYLPGDTFGLETMAQHTFSAEAVTDVDVTVIKGGVSSAQLWNLMGGELRRTQEHVLLLAKTAPERVATFLLEMARRIRSRNEVELPMSRQDIADYLGLTIETVSRTLTQLENEAAIALPTSKRIVLRNRATLKRLNS